MTQITFSWNQILSSFDEWSAVINNTLNPPSLATTNRYYNHIKRKLEGIYMSKTTPIDEYTQDLP